MPSLRLTAIFSRWVSNARQSASGSPSVTEFMLAAFVLLGLLVAVCSPVVGLPHTYHAFADQRDWLGLPYAMDVLTNLPFALMGFFLLRAARQSRGQVSSVHSALATLTGLGLVTTMLCSSIYHLQPDASGLALDRLGMALAFAGVLGLASANRVSDRAGWMMACAVGVLAPLAAWWDLSTANMTPWAVLQGAGLVLLLVLAVRPARAGAVRIPLWPVLFFYALAKILELADEPVLALTQGLISGHSAKHLVAALALWPVASSFQRLGPRKPAAVEKSKFSKQGA
ncbi:hypothetical protein [Ottowia thiooxydans]|uniref:hypothetical protein n=1 Tax=Ottowia thiooxydans TaxID=219182 RepID=UPI0003FCFDAB|nr:hypothetical protein [Ottowia thiooxydans]